MIVSLPWPHKDLSPNGRVHWAVKAKQVKLARTAACYALMAAGTLEGRKAVAGVEGKIYFKVRFFPPDRRHRDDDGMIGSFKSARDGLADALGVDDRRFRPHYFFEDPLPPGKIEVEFE